MSDPHYLGEFQSLSAVWKMFPNGAGYGDYITIGGVRYYWDESTNSWGEDPGDVNPALPEIVNHDIDVQGTVIARDGIKTADYIPDEAGAHIDHAGNAEFRTLKADTIRLQDPITGKLIPLAEFIKMFKTELPPDWSEYTQIPQFDDVRILAFDPISDEKFYTTIGALKQLIRDSIAAGGVGTGTFDIEILRTDDPDAIPTDNNVMSSLRTLMAIQAAIAPLTGEYLSRINDDTAQGLITFLKGLITAALEVGGESLFRGLARALEGIQFGEFSQGIHTGKGGRIDQFGRAELESLVLRSFLEVPELRYNRQTIVGDEIAISDGGTIEDVWQYMDENEEPIEPDVFVLKLKLEEGEVIPFHTHDILKGIYHQQGGFRTSWFRVIDTSAEDGTISVVMGNSESVPGGVNYPPVKFMNIARRGNFVDVERQSSIYISAKEGKIIMLDGVDNYMAGVRSFQIGKPSGLEDVVDFDKFTQIDQNQSYLYARGILVRDIIEVDAHGAPLRTKRDRGMWSIEVAESDDPYLFTDKYQDIVWVGANRYRCIVNETTQEPSEAATDWVLDLAIDIEAELPKMIEIIGPRVLKNPDSGGTASISLKVVKHNFSGTVKWEYLYMSYWQATPWYDNIVIDWATHSSLFQNGILQLRCSSLADPSIYAITSIAVVRDGEDGQDGEAGAGILSVTDWYAVSTNGTTAPSTGWSTTIPSKPANYYLWNYEVITYTDGRTPTQTQKRVIQGKDARSIHDIKNAYAYSASDTVPPTSGWQYSIAALGEKPAGYFLWVREDIAYTDNPSNYISTTGYVVRDGEPGKDGIAPIIIDGFWAFWDEDTQTFIKSSFSAIGDDGHSPYVGANGNWYQWVPESGTYEDTGIKAEGDPGEDGYSVSLSKSEHTFNYDKNGNLKGLLSDGMVSVEVMKGSNALICDSLGVLSPTVNDTYRVTSITQSPTSSITYNVDRPNSVFRIIPTQIVAEEVMVTLTIVARTKGINTTFTRQLKYQKSHDGADGTDGDSVVHIYKQYPTKPATPSSGVINPTGWSRNPDYSLSIVSQTNWTVNGKWRQSEELTTTGNSATSRITFTTYKNAQTITLELWADGHATYDYVYAGKLDTAASTSNYRDRVRGGRIIITYDVPTAGNHYIDIFWRKGIATAVGSNRGYYAIISDVKVWRSTTNVIGGVAQDWSEPQQFNIDTSAEERIYCLSKTMTAPVISDSDAYINDYIPLPCSLSSYRGDFTTNRAYSVGQVVRYQFEYYKVVKSISSSSTRYPTDEEYFEKIPSWTDNPVGANKDYPFEFVAIRKKQADGLWGQFVPSVWTKWAADGHSPYIDETTNTWWTWDEELGIYTDTGYSPVGSDGAIPYPAGYYDNTKWYRREAGYAPYVQYGGTLYLLIKDTPNAGIPTTNTEYWKAFNNWQAVFVDSLVAAFAKIGGAVFTGDTTGTSSGIRGRLISETGVKSGADNTNYSEYVGDSGAWIPKLMLDFLTGAAYFGAKKIMFNPDGSGHLANGNIEWQADGTAEYSGTLKGVSGSFKTLHCKDEYGNTVGTIKFGTDGRIWFENCSIAHQTATGPFLGSDMWVRGAFGTFEKTAIRILGSYGYVYAKGLSGSSEYFTLTQRTSTEGTTYYDIPLYSPTTQSSGCPIDIVIINHSYSSAMNYNLQYIPGKTVVVVNSNNNNNNVYIFCNGIRKQISGGVAATFVCVGSFQNPDNSLSLGRGWFMSGRVDNDWT